MKDKEQNNQRPAERQPLMNKLEPTHNSHSAWQREGAEWSKTGRNMVEMIRDLLEWLLGG